MQDISQKIIDSAGKLFMQYGFKSITMDDVAKDLSISKKTIYQVFKDKNEIVCTVTERFLRDHKIKFDAVEDDSNNAIEKIYKASLLAREIFEKIHPYILYDLEKFYGEAWNLYLKYKQDIFLNALISNLQEGINEGYFRDDIDIQVMASLRMEEIQLAFNIMVSPTQKLDLKEVQQQLFDHFLYGIVSEKGYSLLKSYKKNAEINEN